MESKDALVGDAYQPKSLYIAQDAARELEDTSVLRFLFVPC